MRPNEGADRDLVIVEAPARARTTDSGPGSGMIALGRGRRLRA